METLIAEWSNGRHTGLRPLKPGFYLYPVINVAGQVIRAS